MVQIKQEHNLEHILWDRTMLETQHVAQGVLMDQMTRLGTEHMGILTCGYIGLYVVYTIQWGRTMFETHKVARGVLMGLWTERMGIWIYISN